MKTWLKLIMVLTMAVTLVSVPMFADCKDTKKEPIKVGAPIPLSGPLVANALAFKRAIILAVDEINAKGGVLGRPLEIIWYDTVDIAPERVETAANFLAAKGVACAHGGWSGSGGDVRSFGKYDFPYFMNDCSASSKSVMMEDPKKFSNVFMMGDTEESYAREYFEGMMLIERKFGYKYPNKDLALIAATDGWSQGIQKGLVKAAKEYGWNVVMEETVPYGTVEWGPVLAKLRALDPAPAWLQVEIISPREVVTFLRSFLKRPTNTLINYGYSGNSPEFLNLMKEEADGIMIASGMYIPIPLPTKDGQDWLERYVKKFGDMPSASMPSVYNGVYAWAEAVEAIGDETKYKEICEHIATHKYEAIPGIPFSFSGGDSDHIVELPYSTMPQAQIQNGEVKTLFWKGELYQDYTGVAHNFIVPRWIKR